MYVIDLSLYPKGRSLTFVFISKEQPSEDFHEGLWKVSALHLCPKESLCPSLIPDLCEGLALLLYPKGEYMPFS